MMSIFTLAAFAREEDVAAFGRRERGVLGFGEWTEGVLSARSPVLALR